MLAALLVSCGAQDVVEVGLLLPLRGTSCEVGAQFRRAAFAAKAYVESQVWLCFLHLIPVVTYNATHLSCGADVWVVWLLPDRAGGP